MTSSSDSPMTVVVPDRDALAEVLNEHADCVFVNVASGSPIRLTCGIEVPPPSSDSTAGWVQLHRLHLAAAILASPLILTAGDLRAALTKTSRPAPEGVPS